MHEMSLVQNLFEQLNDIAKKHNARAISKVIVQIGTLSGVVIESFAFAFDVLKKDNNLLKKAELKIDSQLPKLVCSNCQKEAILTDEDLKQLPYKASIFNFNNEQKCQYCQKGHLYPEGGDEILLLQVEME